MCLLDLKHELGRLFASADFVQLETHVHWICFALLKLIVGSCCRALRAGRLENLMPQLFTEFAFLTTRHILKMFGCLLSQNGIENMPNGDREVNL